MSGILNLNDVALPGSGYQSITNMIVPDLGISTSGLVGLYQFGGTLAASLVNQVNPAAPLTVVGAPTINPTGVVCSNANRFDTGLPETADYTFVALVQAAASGTEAVYISNNGPTEPKGASLFGISTHGESKNTDSTNTTVTKIQGWAAPVDTDWRLVVGRGASAGGLSVPYIGQKGANSTAGTAATTGRTVASRNLQIGGASTAIGTSTPANSNILLAAIYTRSISDAEALAVIAALRIFYATGGIAF